MVFHGRVRDGKNVIDRNDWTLEFISKHCTEAGQIRCEIYSWFNDYPGIDVPLYSYTTNEGNTVYEFIEYLHGDEPVTIFLALKDSFGNVIEESREDLLK